MNDDVSKIIEEYRSLLEEAYGANLMSEGGTEAIDIMLAHEDLNEKNILDIGFGLGGVAFDIFNVLIYRGALNISLIIMVYNNNNNYTLPYKVNAHSQG